MSEYNISVTTTAMCIWEEILRCRVSDAPLDTHPRTYYEVVSDDIGAVAFRELTVQVASRIEAAFDNLTENGRERLLHESGLDAWDWEYIPAVLLKIIVSGIELADLTVDDVLRCNYQLMKHPNAVKSEGAK